ncbi:MAG: hypothetical protein ACI8WA_000004 [Polaribacter sp.]|jgi:hypothetical protein
MPKIKSKNMKQRDFKTLRRFNIASDSCNVLKNFFQKGFKNFHALFAIVQNFHPEITEKMLWDFWHFRKFDEKMLNVLEGVYEKLKAE